jgi:hypothetical protein
MRKKLNIKSLWLTVLLTAALLPAQANAQGLFHKLKQEVQQDVQGPQLYYFCWATYNPNPNSPASVTITYYSDLFLASNSQQGAISGAWAAALKPHGIYAADTGACGPWDKTKAEALARRDKMIANEKIDGKVIITDWTYKKGFTDTSQLPSVAEAAAKSEEAKVYYYCKYIGFNNGDRVAYFSDVFLSDPNRPGDDPMRKAWQYGLTQHGVSYPIAAMCEDTPTWFEGHKLTQEEKKSRATAQRDRDIRSANSERYKVYVTDFDYNKVVPAQK